MRVHALAGLAEDADHFGGPVGRGAQAVRHPSVELGRLAALDDVLAVAEGEPETPAEDVQPLVAVVDPRSGRHVGGRVRHLVRAHGRVRECERCDHHAVAAFDRAAHPRVTRPTREQVVDSDAQLPGERQQQFEGCLPLS